MTTHRFVDDFNRSFYFLFMIIVFVIFMTTPFLIFFTSYCFSYPLSCFLLSWRAS